MDQPRFSTVTPDNRHAINQPNWLHWLEHCSSTNTWAIEHAAQLHHGDVVFTRHQTAGRGQYGRIWHAPPGVLTASFVLDQMPQRQLPALSLAVGLAIIYAVEFLLPNLQDALRLKWSNDIWVAQHKVAGILCEAVSRSTAQTTRVVVGVGLNCWVDFAAAGLTKSEIGNAVSLHQISRSLPDEMALLEQLRHHLMQTTTLLAASKAASDNPGLTALLPEMHHRDALFNQEIKVELETETLLGRAVGIDSGGRLQVELADRRILALTAGRVYLRSSNG